MTVEVNFDISIAGYECHVVADVLMGEDDHGGLYAEPERGSRDVNIQSVSYYTEDGLKPFYHPEEAEADIEDLAIRIAEESR